MWTNNYDRMTALKIAIIDCLNRLSALVRGRALKWNEMCRKVVDVIKVVNVEITAWHHLKIQIAAVCGWIFNASEIFNRTSSSKILLGDKNFAWS